MPLIKNNILKNLSINFNSINEIDGLFLLNNLYNEVISACFFDPQYRGILEKMKYGNEGKRQKKRVLLSQMPENIIIDYITNINRVLKPSGYLFLWIDKFHLCEGIKSWIENTDLHIVDLITWNKETFGMGYRTRRTAEYLLILQKQPLKVKNHWTNHTIKDTYCEKIKNKIHPHQKPIKLQEELISAISNPNDIILDPAAGSYSVWHSAHNQGRVFLGCDIKTIDNLLIPLGSTKQ